MLFELTFMFIIILGRWLLPKGNISHSALSQLLLVYLSLASDILDLLTLFSEREISISLQMVHSILFVFSSSMLQFALNLTATRGRSFYAELDDTEYEIYRSVQSPSSPASTSIHRKILDKPTSPPISSSTTRPLTTMTRNQGICARPRAMSFSFANAQDTILENVGAQTNFETKTNRNTMST